LEKSERALGDVTRSYEGKLREMEGMEGNLGEAKDGLLESMSKLKWIKDE
jgi:hypothetical protein